MAKRRKRMEDKRKMLESRILSHLPEYFWSLCFQLRNSKFFWRKKERS